MARRNTLISRMPSILKRAAYPPLESVLRMLVVISAPNDPSCVPLDTEKERDRILQAVDRLYVQRKMDVDFTDDATFETILTYLNEKDYHIVHFIGHGKEVNGKGYLVLESEDGRAMDMDNQPISDLFSGRGIRLVVLNACKSTELANKLVRNGVPAVVAMQYSISDPSAAAFAFAFYQALANGRAVDRSMTEARLAMRNIKGSNKIDFATPVLYLLDPDCLHVDTIKSAVTEFIQRPVMLGAVQVMKEGFVGRQRELRILQKAFLSSVKRAIIVYGWGGIGKTVLATRLVMKMDRHFEGFFGYKCNPQTRPEDILNEVNAFLNRAGIQELNQIFCNSSPLQVKTDALVSILNQRRFLIILDNFESCLDEGRVEIADPELRRFVAHLLNATTYTKYLITTRYDFDPLHGRLMGAIEHLSVSEMPLYQAVWLMNSHSNLALLDLETKENIYRIIGGHPWAIGMFAHHASIASVDGLLLELEPLERDLKDFTLFDKSYSGLDKSSKELLLHASIFEEAMPIEALRWIIGDEKMPSPPVNRSLDTLLRWGLMTTQEDGEETLYSIHTQVREFVRRGVVGTNGVDSRRLLMRAAQYYELKVKDSGNLWDLLRSRDYYYRAEDWEMAAHCVTAIWEYLARWGYVKLAISLLQQSMDTTSGTSKAIAKGNLAVLYRNAGDWETALKLLTEAREQLEMEGESNNVASVLHLLGIIHQDQGNYSEAVKLYEQSLALKKDLADESGISLTLHQLGNVHYLQGNYTEALKLYEQSLDIAQNLGDKYGISNSLWQLGNVHYQQGNYTEALKFYEQSLALKKDLGDKLGISGLMFSVGMIFQNMGDYAEAVKLYEQSLALKRDLGDKSGISGIFHQLGMIHENQGNYAEAVKLYEQSLALKKDLGDKSGMASSLHQLGMIHENQGNYAEAVKLYEQSLDIAQNLGDKSGIARSLHQLGNVYYRQQNYSEALRLYEQSLDIVKYLGDKSGMASSLHQLGTIYYQQRNYSEALRLYEQSLALKIDLCDKSGISFTFHMLGMILQNQGNYSGAMRLYEQSLALKRDLGDKSGIAISLNQMGLIKEAIEDFVGALKDYYTAFFILEKLKDPRREIVNVSLSRLRGKMGEEAFNKARNGLGGPQ